MMQKKMKMPAIALAAICLMLAAGNASAFNNFSDNLTTGAGWTDSVSQTATAESFGAGGLTLTSNPTGDFQRQAVAYTTRNDLDWVGEAGPITYSFTLSDFPTAITSGSAYEANMLLLGNQANPLPNFADFNAANVLMFRVSDFGPQAFLGGANQYGAELLIKTGAPSDSIFNGTKIAAVYNSTPGTLLNPLGKWSFTINTDGTAFITAPDGQISVPGAFTGTGSLPGGANAFFNTATMYLQLQDGNQTGSDSITFSNVAVIPEASTVFSMVCGLGLMMGRFLVSRKREKLV
jgi:hypothetical protein